MILREASLADVDQISGFLRQLTALGKRVSPDDAAFVRANYVEAPDRIRCTAAEDTDGTVLGFFSR